MTDGSGLVYNRIAIAIVILIITVISLSKAHYSKN